MMDKPLNTLIIYSAFKEERDIIFQMQFAIGHLVNDHGYEFLDAFPIRRSLISPRAVQKATLPPCFPFLYVFFIFLLFLFVIFNLKLCIQPSSIVYQGLSFHARWSK